MKRFLWVILCSFLGSGIQAQIKKDSVAVKPITLPSGFTSKIDLVYTRVNGWDGKMDLYLPPVSAAPTPLIINIHGGGWNHGDKEGQSGFGIYFKEGYAVANIEYRLVAVAPAPAAIEDTRCA